MNYRITVFTPTYNRAYIIENLYKSLQRQTVKDFEWLVVDDGSMDETEEMFHKWKSQETTFSIRYYKKENGGKCSAINYALDLAQGELFFNVDSDDYLTDDAIEKVLRWENELPKGEKFCGISGNIGTSPADTTNTLFEKGYYDGDLLERYKNVDGERAIVFYTDIHRKYRYPLFDGEKFMTEAVVWNRMAKDGYKMRFYNDVIWIYEYLEDGLTKAGNKLFLNNPRGYGLWLREKSEFMKEPFINRFKMYYAFTCEMYGRISAKETAECIGASRVIIEMARKLHSIKRKPRK